MLSFDGSLVDDPDVDEVYIVMDNGTVVPIAGHFKLLMTNKSITPPEPKTYKVNVPCRSGSIDLSEVLLGDDLTYEDREAEFKFVYVRYEVADEMGLQSDILDLLHGRRLQFVLGADPTFMYVGRFSVDFDRDGCLGVVTVKADCDPFKSKRVSAVAVPHGDETFFLKGGRLRTRPTFTTTGPCSLTFDGKTYDMDRAGVYEYDAIEFGTGYNRVRVVMNDRDTTWQDFLADDDEDLTWSAFFGKTWEGYKHTYEAGSADSLTITYNCYSL